MPLLSPVRTLPAALLLLLAVVGFQPAEIQANTTDRTPELDVDYVPTPMPAVRRMLEMGQVGRDDYVVDLGSGDGRILITAARKHDVRSALGIELDPWLVEYATAQAHEAGVADRVSFIEGDIFEADFADADVVTMYLLPQLNLELRPYLLSNMAPGTRIVSHSFDMGEWQPDEQDSVFNRGVYLWIIPAQVAGTWEIRLDADTPPILLTLTQEFQQLSGQAKQSGKPLKLGELSLRGPEISFRLNGKDYAGIVKGSTIESAGEREWFATLR